MIPVSSPCAPAEGWSEQPSIPLTSQSICGELPHDLERALRQRVGRHRVEPEEAGDPRRPLVDLGVVLHRARPERIELRVDAEIPLREPDEVAERLGLAHLGEARGLARGRARRSARAGSTAGTSSGASDAPDAAGRAPLEDGRLAELDALGLRCGHVGHGGLGDRAQRGLAAPRACPFPCCPSPSRRRRRPPRRSRTMESGSGGMLRCFIASQGSPTSSSPGPISPAMVSSTLSPAGRLYLK